MSDETFGPFDREAEERKAAAEARRYFGVDGNERVDALACVSSGYVWTVRGIKRLVLEVVPDAELFGADAITSADTKIATIRLASSVYCDALARRPRATMTLAHELGHVVLCHPLAALARLTGAGSSAPRSSEVRRCETSAKLFASFFLLRPDFVERYSTAIQISQQFGVSIPAAEISLEKINKKRAKSRVLQGFAELKEHFGTSRKSGENESTISTLVDLASLREEDGTIWLPCTCTRGRGRPIGGGKYRCTNCGYVGELPDGDSCGEP